MINKKDRTAEQLAQAAGVAAMSSAATQRVDVKKWAPTSSQGGMVAVVTNAPEHTYVKWTDYAALLQQLADAMNAVNGLTEELESAESKLAERDAEIERLTLENRTTWQQNATLREGVAPLHAKLAAAERAREEVVELLREVYDTVVLEKPITPQPVNLAGRIAAFLAANAPTHSAGGE